MNDSFESSEFTPIEGSAPLLDSTFSKNSSNEHKFSTVINPIERLKELFPSQETMRKRVWTPKKLPSLKTMSILESFDSYISNSIDNKSTSNKNLNSNVTINGESRILNKESNDKEINVESHQNLSNQFVNIYISSGIISISQEKLQDGILELFPNQQLLIYLFKNTKSQYKPFQKIFGNTLASNALQNLRQELHQFKYYQKQLFHIENIISNIILNSEQLQTIAHEMIEETKEFDDHYKQLTERIQHLEYFTYEVKDRLTYFDNMEHFHQMLRDSWNLQLWKQNLKKNYFSEQLQKLDDRIKFLETHSEYKHADLYCKKLKQIKFKALSILRDIIVLGFKEITQNINSEILKQSSSKEFIDNTNNDTTSSIPDSKNSSLDSLKDTNATSTNLVIKQNSFSKILDSNFEIDIFGQQFSLLYIEFQSQSEYLRRPIELIENRCEFGTPTTSSDDTSSISSLTSKSASYSNEFHIYLQDCFHTYHEQRKSLLLPIIQQQSNALAETGNLIQIARIGCSIIIQFTIQETKLVTKLFKSPYVKASFKEMIQSFCFIMFESLRTVIIHEDNIETLAACVEILRREILHDSIKPKRNYLRYIEPIVHRMIQDVQERLIFKSSLYIRENIQLYSPTDEDLNFPSRFQSESSQEILLPYNNWYPPLQRSLSLLSKLYNRIEMSVFEGLAHEIVLLCTESFVKASQIITQRSSSLDGELFLISHLLALRMELIPFDKLNLSNVETSFDFTHVKEGIVRFLKGQASFQMKSLIYDIMSNTQPKVVHNAVDSKKNLEKRLKVSYDGLVINVTKLCFDDLIIYLKSLHIKQHKADAKTNDSSFNHMNYRSIEELYEKSMENIEKVFSKELVPKMNLYIKQQKTRNELFRGIQDSLVSVYVQFLTNSDKGQFLDAQSFQDKLSKYQETLNE